MHLTKKMEGKFAAKSHALAFLQSRKIAATQAFFCDHIRF
jgi:hypothetical protein